MYKKHFDKGTKPLKPLSINDRVRLYDTISKTWNETGFVTRFDGPRSYIVKTDNGSTFKRNRVHLKPVLNSVQANQNLSLSVSQPNKTSGQSLSVDVECPPDLALRPSRVDSSFPQKTPTLFFR